MLRMCLLRSASLRQDAQLPLIEPDKTRVWTWKRLHQRKEDIHSMAVFNRFHTLFSE